MDVSSSISAIGAIITALIVLSAVEVVIPLRPRGEWNRRHLIPNLSMTILTFFTNLFFNIPILFGLVWLESRGWGLFNAVSAPAWLQLIGSIIVLDFAWYATHVSMHKVPALWRVHTIHHSDPAVDVTTTIRQHPLESVVRYLFLAAFAFTFGVSIIGFAIYRVASVVYGQFEHSNIQLPQWIDTAITFVAASPNMHKIHHSTDARFTDTNYSSLVNWDRMFGTFVPSKHGRDVQYGLDGFNAPEDQTVWGLLMLPFRQDRLTLVAGRESSGVRR